MEIAESTIVPRAHRNALGTATLTTRATADDLFEGKVFDYAKQSWAATDHVHWIIFDDGSGDTVASCGTTLGMCQPFMVPRPA